MAMLEYLCTVLFGRSRPSLKCCKVKCAVKIVLVLSLVLVVYLHIWVLPRSTGYYNDECYLSPKEVTDMKFLLTRVTEAFNQHNMTYWLDYGTLLGIWRSREIISYDGDIDIGRLSVGKKEDILDMERVRKQLLVDSINSTTFRANYNGKHADLGPWEVDYTQANKSLKRFDLFVEDYGIMERTVNYLLPVDVPRDLILPTREITVYGVRMKIPNKPLEVLKLRYPLTWFISFPYKWRCFL